MSLDFAERKHYCPIKVGKSVFEIIEIQSIKPVFEMKRI